jgi:hypothetical protein
MPQFYFDISCSGVHQNDSEGLAFENEDQARTEALKALCEIAWEETPRSTPNEFIVLVRDGSGKVVLAATLCLRGGGRVVERQSLSFLHRR